MTNSFIEEKVEEEMRHLEGALERHYDFFIAIASGEMPNKAAFKETLLQDIETVFMHTSTATYEQGKKEGKNEERERYIGIFKWLLGYDDFPQCPDNARYCWRTHLQRKLPDGILRALENEK